MAKNKREKTKYPALDSTVNIPSRKDLIDFDYLDQLDDSELEFLNKFVEETVVTNFAHHPEIRKLIKLRKKIIEDDQVQDLKSQVKELRKDKSANGPEIKRLLAIIKVLKKQNEETYADRLELIEDDLKDLREQFLLYPDKEDHKQFYNENNSRNMCIYTKKKTEYRLDELNTEKYDEMTNKGIYHNVAEDELIESIERERWEEEEERLLAVDEEIKLSERNLKSKKQQL